MARTINQRLLKARDQFDRAARSLFIGGHIQVVLILCIPRLGLQSPQVFVEPGKLLDGCLLVVNPLEVQHQHVQAAGAVRAVVTPKRLLPGVRHGVTLQVASVWKLLLAELALVVLLGLHTRLVHVRMQKVQRGVQSAASVC